MIFLIHHLFSLESNQYILLGYHAINWTKVVIPRGYQKRKESEGVYTSYEKFLRAVVAYLFRKMNMHMHQL